MPIHIKTKDGQTLEWSETVDKPRLPIYYPGEEAAWEISSIKKLSASGSALLFIKDHFSVPLCYDKEANGSHVLKPVITWSGDIAQFIYDNLD